MIKPRVQIGFLYKMIFGIVLISVIGLVAVYYIVTSVMQESMYDSSINSAQQTQAIYAQEIDSSFLSASFIASNIVTSLEAMSGSDDFESIITNFTERHEIIDHVFVGFADGRIIGGNPVWPPADVRHPTIRSWYRNAVEAGEGVLAISDAYLCGSTGDVTVTMSMLASNIDGSEAVVGFAFNMEFINSFIEASPVVGGGYLVLVTCSGQIIYHPNVYYRPSPYGIVYLSEIPYGEFMLATIEAGIYVAEFEDFRLGAAYFIAATLPYVGWTLYAVVPSGVIVDPVRNNITTIIDAFAFVLICLALFIMIFITSLTRNMQEKDKVEKMMKAMINAAPIACYMTDEQMEEVLLCNDTLVSLFELSSADDFNRRYYDLLPEYQPDGKNSREKAKEMLTEIDTVGKYQGEWLYHRQSGEQIPCEVTIEKIDLDGKIVHVGYLRDLREQQDLISKLESALSREQSANQAKSRFLSNMSHEIRTPMNAIIGMTEITKNTDDPSKIRHCLDNIEKASTHLLSLINRIMDMSKIEADKLEVSMSSFDYRKMMDEVTSVLSVLVEQKEIDLNVEIDGNVPKYVTSDELLIAQVITNLLSNAIKFSNNGGTVSLRSKCNNSNLIISVVDNGVGIPEEKQGAIFNAFEQSDNSITRNYGGTGLGLSISKSIATMLGGDISLTSKLGVGSTFTLEIPFEAADTNFETVVEEKSKYTDDFSRYTILIAEDVELNREILLELLKDTGINIECAENGQEVLTMFSENQDKYSLIFMDIQMPIMDGITASKRIRELGTTSAVNIPIIAMTANVFQEDVDNCINAGMNDHFGKPIDVSVMYEKLRYYLSEKGRDT